MTYRGDYAWSPGATKTKDRIAAEFGMEAKKGGALFTYDGHGGDEESPDRCIDIWTGTSKDGRALGREVVAWLLPRMEDLNIWYVVHDMGTAEKPDPRIFSRTYPKDIFQADGKTPKGRKYNARNDEPSNLHSNHVHVSCYPDKKADAPTPEPSKPSTKAQVIIGGVIDTPFRKPGTAWKAGYHPGDDWNDPKQRDGATIHSAVSGKVVDVGSTSWGSAFGNVVTVEDPSGDRTAHCHLKSWSVKVGDRVKAGDPIGVEGSTGNVTGPHCHVERRHKPYGYYDHEKPVYEDLVDEEPWDGASFPGASAFAVGETHPAVTLLGQRLVAHGWTGYSDGPGPRFTETDKAGVEWFQKLQGWTGSDADGIPGPSTWARLMAEPKPAPTKPTPPKPQPEKDESTPVTTETFLSFNTRRSTADVTGYAWERRKGAAIGLIKDSGASLLAVQECTPKQRAAITSETGLEFYARGNVAVGWDPDVWTCEHDNYYRLPAGTDPRAAVVVVVKHKKTGRELKVASVHLTNLEGPKTSDEWRLAQAKALVSSVDGLDVIMGDFNSSKIFTFFAEQGFADAREKATTVLDREYRSTHSFGKPTSKDGRWIDNILSRSGVKLRKVWLEMTGSNSSHPNASDHNAVAATIEI